MNVAEETMKVAEDTVTVAEESVMAVNNPINKPRRWFRKSIKILGIAGISVFFLYSLAGLIWRFSGSNQWELAAEKNGAKVYTLKMPGSDMLQVKGVMRYRSTLAGMVKLDTINDSLVAAGATHIADLGGDDQA